MTRKGQDRTGGPVTGRDPATRAARLRAALRQNLARRKARAHALARPATPPHDVADPNPPGGVSQAPPGRDAADPRTGAAGEPLDAPTDPAKDE